MRTSNSSDKGDSRSGAAVRRGLLSVVERDASSAGTRFRFSSITSYNECDGQKAS